MGGDIRDEWRLSAIESSLHNKAEKHELSGKVDESDFNRLKETVRGLADDLSRANDTISQLEEKYSEQQESLDDLIRRHDGEDTYNSFANASNNK